MNRRGKIYWKNFAYSTSNIKLLQLRVTWWSAIYSREYFII